MRLTTQVVLVFRNKEGNKLQLEITIKEMLEKTLDEFYEQIEPECTSASCNNEGQNFCDCGAVYEDYDIDEVLI